MSRIARKNRTDIKIATSGGLLDLMDNTVKEIWWINDEEYDYICEHASEQEVDLLVTETVSFNELKKALNMVNKYLNQKYNETN